MSSRPMVFARSVLAVGVAAMVVPWALTEVAVARFGGRAPWSGLPPVGEWRPGAVRDALTGRLTESTVADVVIRVALGVAWVAVAVFVVTVVAEAVHMVRHGGLSMPSVRGLGLAQPLARVVAAGLLAVLPAVGSGQRAIAHDVLLIGEDGHEVMSPADDLPADGGWADLGTDPLGGTRLGDTDRPGATSGSATVAGDGVYVVQPGDSVYAIAERFAGPDPRAVAEFADLLLDLNLGTQMNDGRSFTNAALIDVGWELRLPDGSVDVAAVAVHVVREGETLWSIADEHLGEPERWPEIYEANRGTTFDDGRALGDPDLIHPGWQLDIPSAAAGGVDEVEAGAGVDDAAVTAAPVAEPESVDGELPSDPPAASVETTAPEADDLRPVNAWIDDPIDEPIDDATDGGAAEVTPPTVAPATIAPPAAPGDVPAVDDVADAAAGAELLTYRRAAMLSTGLLTLLAVRRRARLRSTPPGARLPVVSGHTASVERELRALDGAERFARVDVAIRHVALSLAEAGARVDAVVVDGVGNLELYASGPVTLAAPWQPGELPSGCRWRLPAAVSVESLAERARQVGAPCPALVQLGCDTEGREVFVDLEAIGVIEVGGPVEQADAVVAAVAATLGSSVLAEVATSIGVGVPEAAFLGHRHHRTAASVDEAFGLAGEAVGSTGLLQRTTFDLRARLTSGEMWEPAVVLVGSGTGPVSPPADRTGMALVSASPIHGRSSRLAPDGDAWTLRPLGLRFTPVGLDGDDIAELAELAAGPPAVEVDQATDITLVAATDDPAPAELPHALVVRLLGPVGVESAVDGSPVEFERSKTKELIAWLATHRERSTRSTARAALWELDVRDATFANVVSEARRALARCVEPPAGEEWLARTLTEALPLHPLVVTDADLVEHALARARSEPPERALATLRPALEWVVGPPFEGTAYLWPDAEGVASRLVMTALELCDTAARLALSAGDVPGALDATGRGLQVLPAHEDMIALRMQAHAQAGDRAGVRLEWESYERAITADPWSDGEPSDRMRALRHDLA